MTKERVFATWLSSFQVEVVKTCRDSTRTFKYSIGTYGNLEGNCKLFLVCSTTMTLIFEINIIRGVTSSYGYLRMIDNSKGGSFYKVLEADLKESRRGV